MSLLVYWFSEVVHGSPSFSCEPLGALDMHKHIVDLVEPDTLTARMNNINQLHHTSSYFLIFSILHSVKLCFFFAVFPCFVPCGRD